MKNGEVKIESKIPLPKLRARANYPFAEMKVGDSFSFPADKYSQICRVRSRLFEARIGGHMGSVEHDERGWSEDAWFVGLQSWAGLTWHRVTVLKECPKRSRVRFEEPAIGRSVGHEQNVPNHALKFGSRPQS